MYYKTPQIKKYLDILIKNRIAVFLFYLFLLLSSLFLYQPKFLFTDELFWLKDAMKIQKTQTKKLPVYTLSTLHVTVDELNKTSRKKLTELHHKLEHLDGVISVSSIFNNDFIDSNKNKNSSKMLVVINADELDTMKLKQQINNNIHEYSHYVNAEFTDFYYFITATKQIDMPHLDLNKYDYQLLDQKTQKLHILIYIFIFWFVVAFLFRVLFKNYIALLSATIVVVTTTILTFTLIMLLTGIKTIHIAMPFITVSIALVDFLYFYYRWHVSQNKHNQYNALLKMLNRSMMPAIWTSVITLMGLGPLIFIDSDIIKLLSLSIILSSWICYITNMSLLPAILSYFELKNAHVSYRKIGYFLISKEIHYNKKFLFGFLLITYSILILGLFFSNENSRNIFQLHVKNEQIALNIPFKKINLPLIKKIDTFTNDLTHRFEEELGETTSLSSIIHTLNNANTQTTTLDTQALKQALFYMDLYNINDKYFDKDTIKITINIFDINKLELINWLQHYKGIDIYFADKDTLLNSAKYNQLILLGGSLLSALIVLGIITGWIFRCKMMVFLGITLNAVAIIWFALFVTVFSVPLSMEILVATAISLGLASDATIHFAFKYFRLRYFGRSKKHALEKMYFYAGMPMAIGSIILITAFSSLYFSHIHSLHLIGLYSAILILFSLLSDLFLLPVLLLFIDPFMMKKAKTAL